MRSTCEKHSRINVPYKYRKIVNDLSRNKDVVIMKQDKRKGVVVMNRGKYFDKSLSYTKYRTICAITGKSNKFFRKKSPVYASKS